MGSFTPSLVVPRVSCPRARFVQENRAARVHIREASSVPMCSAGIGSRTTAVLLKNTTRSGRRSNCTTIAPMMLAPCSASSTLSASLRPGRRPGLRALTTPVRGTVRQLRDGGRSDEAHNGLDDDIARAYVGFIPSVPLGTPPVSPQRHPERAFRRPPQGHGLKRIPHNIAACCRTTENG